jgi:BirA family biotin operon repressor/biotin-[acetyl-CoA-carboxylase] ligase
MATAQDADVRVLRALRSRAGGWIPAETISVAARLTAAEVSDEMADLRAAGFTIDANAAGNRRLAAAPARLIAADLLAGLSPVPAAGVGREIAVFEETNSTNDLAARAGDAGIREGLVIFAETQRAGRGRLGRSWQSPPRQGLWFSVLLRPGGPAERWSELTFYAALAVAEAAEIETGRAAAIKWPNDVLIDGRKVCGILLESHQRQSPGYVVVGIGLNVLQGGDDFAPELRERAGSLQMAAAMAGRAVSRRSAAIAVLARLEQYYRGWPANFDAVKALSLARGCREPAA